MSKPLLLSIGNGKVQELVGGTNNYVPVWNESMQEWQAAPSPGGGGGGSGTVTSVGLTGGTSGIVIGGTTSPITTSGTFDLDAPHKFAFDTVAPVAPTAAGEMAWDTAEGSLNTMMVGGNVDAIVGQQLYQRVVNADTVTLTKGMVVYVYGSSGTRVTAKRAIANADLTSATILGVVAESIAQNAEGFVITNGLLKDLSVLPLTSFTDGLPVYLSPTTAGGLTQTKPTAPEHLVLVGYCVKSSNGAAGVLLVHPQNGYELGELHDVYINGPTSGQILIYDGLQTRWENASLGSSNGVAVTPGAGSLSVGLDATSSPTLTGLTLSGLTASRFVVTNGSSTLSSQQYVSLSSEVSGTLPAANGGTGQSTWTTGDLLYASAANTLSKRPIGSTGQILTVVAGVPAWAAPATSGTVTSVSTVTTGMGLTMAVTDPSGAATITLAGTLAVSAGGTGKSYAGETGVVKVLGGVFETASDIVDGDVSASAGILRSKLATGNNAWCLVANNGSGVMTELASTGTSGQVLTSTGTGSLPTFQSLPSVPYDVSGEVGGTPSISTEVFHFKAVRAWTLAASGHVGGVVTAPTGSAVTFDIYKNTSGTPLGTISFATSGTVSISITASGATLNFASGDVLVVKTQSTVNSMSNPYFTFVGTVG